MLGAYKRLLVSCESQASNAYDAPIIRVAKRNSQLKRWNTKGVYSVPCEFAHMFGIRSSDSEVRTPKFGEAQARLKQNSLALENLVWKSGSVWLSFSVVPPGVNSAGIRAVCAFWLEFCFTHPSTEVISSKHNSLQQKVFPSFSILNFVVLQILATLQIADYNVNTHGDLPELTSESAFSLLKRGLPFGWRLSFGNDGQTIDRKSVV